MSQNTVPLDALGSQSAPRRLRKSRPIPTGSKILLLLPPFYTPYTPPLGISVLKAYIEQYGYQVKCFDFNTIPHIWVAHHRYFEVMQELEGLTPQHGYTNLWYILQAHMMAHLSGLGSMDCARVLSQVLPVYDLKPTPEVVNGLVPIVNRLFRDIERVLESELDLSSFAVVGTSTYSTSLAPSLFILRRVKEIYPEIVTMMGGGVFADDLAVGSDNLSTLLRGFPFVDHVVIGEGEVVFRELLRGTHLSEGPLTREQVAGRQLDVKELAMPDYSDFQIPNYLHLCIEGARSCPFQCQFCSETVQWGGYRKKPSGVLADQMVRLAQKCGNKTFFMGDSLMNPYIEDLSTSLLERGADVLYDGYLRADKIAADRARVERWAKSGCVRTRLGIESASAKVLTAMKKETNPETISKVIRTLASAGIRVTTLWIVGFPGETDADFRETLDFIREHHRYIYELDVHYYYYYPYGQIWSRLHKSYPLYSQDVLDAVKFQQWEIVDCDPPRHVKFDRLRQINDLATELGIPNLHTLKARYNAEERWQLSFPLAAEFFEGTLVGRTPHSTPDETAEVSCSSAIAGTSQPGESEPPLTYLVRVGKRLDEGILRRTAETLVAYNDVLQYEANGQRLKIARVPMCLGPRIANVLEAGCADEAQVLMHLKGQIWPSMKPEPGDSVRIVAFNDAESSYLAVSAHRAVADSRSVVLLLEDLFRIYEQLAHDKPVTLRGCNVSYMDFVNRLPSDRHASSVAGREPDGADEEPIGTMHFALRGDLVQRLTPEVLRKINISFSELIYAVLARTLVGSESEVVECRADLRILHPKLEHTCGPLHATRRAEVSPRASTALEDAHNLTRGLRKALSDTMVASDPMVSKARISLNLEGLTAVPWMGGDAWSPQGFLADIHSHNRAPIEVRAFLKQGRVWVAVQYNQSEAATVENWRNAEERGTTLWERLLAEIDERSRPARQPKRVAATPRFHRRDRQPVSVDELLEFGSLNGSTDKLLPLVIQPRTLEVDVFAWVAANREYINHLLLKHGGLLFRGFDITTPADFRRFATCLTDEILEFSERAAPRIEVANRVYTSTEYPAEYPIPLHHENAFAYKWPMKVFFYCQTPALQGGETPIADDQAFLKMLAPEIREEFRRKKVMYVRNYGTGVDLPWQEVFQTQDRSEVEQYCRAGNLRWEWRGPNWLRTVRVSPAILQHPFTGKDVWFNHAHLFHVSNLEAALRESLLREFQAEDLPRNTYYGDGTPIDDSVLDHIRQTYAKAAVRFPWQFRDVLLVDNMAVAHGREPFVGARTTLVIMAESSESAIKQLPPEMVKHGEYAQPSAAP